MGAVLRDLYEPVFGGFAGIAILVSYFALFVIFALYVIGAAQFARGCLVPSTDLLRPEAHRIGRQARWFGWLLAATAVLLAAIAALSDLSAVFGDGTYVAVATLLVIGIAALRRGRRLLELSATPAAD
jgi:amino acid transporter